MNYTIWEAYSLGCYEEGVLDQEGFLVTLKEDINSPLVFVSIFEGWGREGRDDASEFRRQYANRLRLAHLLGREPRYIYDKWRWRDCRIDKDFARQFLLARLGAGVKEARMRCFAQASTPIEAPMQPLWSAGLSRASDLIAESLHLATPIDEQTHGTCSDLLDLTDDLDDLHRHLVWKIRRIESRRLRQARPD